MKPSNRRDFLKHSTAAGAGLAATGFAPRKIFAQESSGFHRVAYRDLGSTGYKASEIGFGAMNTRDEELIHAAIDSGINYIDTAHGYMNGVNEQIIGQVMNTRRDTVFLTTKIGGRNPKEMPGMIETSMKRLQTDHVDLLLLHGARDREQVLRDDYMKIFDNALKKGMTRFVGISTHNQVEFLDAMVESKFWEAALVPYNYFTPPDVSESIKKAREAGIAIIAMKNLLNPQSFPWKKIEDIREDKTSPITPEQALIKWVLENKYIDTTIPGMTSFEQLADDLAIMGTKLTFDDRRLLRRYSERLKGHYCCGLSGCTGCKDKCPNGVAIHEINRCLGYAYGYGNIELARENYRALPSSSRVDICSECDECTVQCVNGLHLTENIRRAKEVFT